MMTKTLTYIHNIHILPRMHVLLFLCDSKVSLAVARRASDVWDLSSRSSGCRVTFNSTVGKLGVAHLFENPWVAVRVSRHQKQIPESKKDLGTMSWMLQRLRSESSSGSTSACVTWNFDELCHQPPAHCLLSCLFFCLPATASMTEADRCEALEVGF